MGYPVPNTSCTAAVLGPIPGKQLGRTEPGSQQRQSAQVQKGHVVG